VSDLEQVLSEAREWLAAQSEPTHGSATWYGLNNLRSFITQVEADPSPTGLERACHALSWHISDQYDAYTELRDIAAFNDRVRRVARAARSGSGQQTDFRS
jgi:hypothetical protein